MMFSNKFLILLSELILAITYSVIMFALVSNKDGAFYVNYGFTCVSFILTLWVSLSIFERETTLHNLFYQIPLFSITLIYGIGQLILSGILAYYRIPSQWTLAASSLVLGLYGTSAISVILIKRFYSVTREIPTEQETFLQDIKLALFDIQQEVSDKTVKDEVKKLIDSITYSDPVSLPETKEIENNIVKMISDMNSKKLSDRDILKLERMLEKRNHLLKEKK